MAGSNDQPGRDDQDVSEPANVQVHAKTIIVVTVSVEKSLSIL